MSKQNITSQIYGYVVCLIAIVVFIGTMKDIVYTIIDCANMNNAKESPSILRESYEKWLFHTQNYIRYSLKDVNAALAEKISVPNEQALKQIYESERQTALKNIQHTLYKSLVADSLGLLVSIIIFILHWIFVRRIIKQI
jgi:hypothetical protein